MTISPERLKELSEIPDEAIDYSDIPELDAEWFKKAVVVSPEDHKTQLTLRLDPDVVLWFKAQGKGYQTRMNAVLRAYYEAHETHRTKKTGTR